MPYLKSWSISSRIGLAVAIPLLAAVGFGGFIIFVSWSTASGASRIEAIAETGPYFGAFIHEVQIERGLTNTVLRNPQNKTAAAARSAQTTRVDHALEALRKAIDAMPSQVRDQDKEAARNVLRQAAGLSSLRTSVVNSAIAPKAAVARYTSLVEAALAPIEALTEDAQIGATARAVIAYSSILRAKEAAGLERATGAGAFTPEGFDRRQYDRFVALGAAEDGFIALARRFGGRAQAATIDEFGASAPAKAIQDLRNLADQAALERGRGIDPLVWFRAATQRIDAMKRLEDQSSSELTKIVAAAADAAHRKLEIALALVLAVAAAAAFAARAIAASITRPLAALTSEMSLLARGDTSTRKIDANREDEIGAMIRAVAVFRENAIERARLEETASAERQNEFRRQAVLEDMIGGFRKLIGEVVASVDSEANAMNGTARTLSDVAFRAEEAAELRAGRRFGFFGQHPCGFGRSRRTYGLDHRDFKTDPQHQRARGPGDRIRP